MMKMNRTYTWLALLVCATALAGLTSADADFTAELQSFTAEAQDADPIVENINELMVAVREAPSELETVKKLLDELKDKLTKEYAAQNAACQKAIQELEDAIRRRNLKIEEAENEITRLLQEAAQREKDRKAQLALIKEIRRLINDHNSKQLDVTVALQLPANKLRLDSVDTETVNVQKMLNVLLANDLQETNPKEIDDILVLLDKIEKRLLEEAKNDPADSQIAALKAQIEKWREENKRDQKLIEEKKAECAKHKAYFEKFMQLIEELLKKLAEMVTHSAVGWQTTNTTVAGTNSTGGSGVVPGPPGSPTTIENCDDVRAQITELEKTNKELKEKNAKLKKQLEDILKELAKCRDDQKVTQAQLEECLKNLKDCGDANDCKDCYTKLEQCQKTRDQCQDDLKKCRVGFEDCRAKNKALQEALKACQDKFDKCTGDKDKCLKDLKLCKAKLKECEDEYAILNPKCQKIKDDLEDCRNKLKDCSSYSAFRKHVNDKLAEIVKQAKNTVTLEGKAKDVVVSEATNVRSQLKNCLANDKQEVEDEDEKQAKKKADTEAEQEAKQKQDDDDDEADEKTEVKTEKKPAGEKTEGKTDTEKKPADEKTEAKTDTGDKGAKEEEKKTEEKKALEDEEAEDLAMASADLEADTIEGSTSD